VSLSETKIEIYDLCISLKQKAKYEFHVTAKLFVLYNTSAKVACFLKSCCHIAYHIQHSEVTIVVLTSDVVFMMAGY
jgi:hypothetical protein